MSTQIPGELTVVGLGPGTIDCVTIQAARPLLDATELAVLDPDHPSVRAIVRDLSTVRPVPVDGVDSLLDLAGRPGGVVFGQPGDLSDGGAFLRVATVAARDRGLPVREIGGLSLATIALVAAGAEGSARRETLTGTEIARMASENAVGETPDGNVLPWSAAVPTAGLLVTAVGSVETAQGVEAWLRRYYPPSHEVCVVEIATDGDAEVRAMPLHRLVEGTFSPLTYLWLPPLAPLENVRTFPGLMNVTRALRAPGGCPWDREQTHETLKKHLLEETYEVLDALDSGDPALLSEELGDLLFQVTIHSQVAAENGTFTVEDVIEHIMRKLIGRHPHVFGDLHFETAEDVLSNWESFKQREKPKRQSIFEHIPRDLPALPQSSLMQKRAAGVGFEWPGLDDVLAKVDEEIAELRHEVETSAPKEAIREEFGDILFALVSVARHVHVDPEEALRLANRKFAARFQYVESRVTAGGRSIRDLSPEELDAYWEEAKALGTARQ